MKKNYPTLPASLLSLIFLCCAAALHAQQLSNCPASPFPVTIKQADGSALTIIGRGSMASPWTETLDGYSVVREKGIYQYATKAAGRLVASGVRARNVRERQPAEAAFLRQVPKSVKPDPAAFPAQDIFRSARPQAQGPQQAGFPTTGKRKALLLLIRYPDLGNTNSTADFDNLMNQPNYRGTGSFKDFFATSSFGQLDISTDVRGWYTAAKDYKYYGWENGVGRSTELVREAVDAAEKAGVDFSQYDNDGDGVVDGIIVAHAGPGAEEGSQLQYIWSHRYRLYDNYVTYDGVLISDYTLNPERRLFTGQMVGIGVYCHEFGHALNLPDLYDTNENNGRSEGLGEWSLMASAGWLGNEHTPGNMCAWSRDALDWLSPVVLDDAGSYSLEAASGSDQVFRINTSLPNEYFLLENRQKTGLDVALNGSGLAIYHVNTDQFNNADADMKMVDLEEADGLNQLDFAFNRGDAGDLFPGASNNTAFSDTTNPNAKTYTDTPTNLSISNISIGETGHAQFQLSLSPALAITTFAPASAPVGAAVAIKGSGLTVVEEVRFNGVAATEVYVAGPTLLYATVPAGASTGPLEVVAQGGAVVTAGEFVVAKASSAWKSRRSLATARAQHGTVAAGGEIYTFGGFNDEDLLKSLEIYNPKKNTWRVGAAMPGASRGMSFTLGSDGLIYVISGFSGDKLTSTYSYNGKTNKWKALALIPEGVWEGAAAAAAKGKVYVFGGEQEAAAATHATRVYDIKTNTWSTAADIPVAVMQHRAITGTDGRIYLIGGRNSAYTGPAGLVQVYDPVTDTWSAGADMLIPKVQFGAAAGANGLIYVIGGKAAYLNSEGPFFHTVEIYDPATDSWSPGPALPAPAGELTAANESGNLYALGGTDGSYRPDNFRLILPPAAPASLSAKAVSATRIDLKWKDVAGNETLQTLERATSARGPFAVITTRGPNKTTYSDTGLQPNTTYYYRLTASSAGGTSAYSNLASAKTAKAKPEEDRLENRQPVLANTLQVGPNPLVDRTQVTFQVKENQQVTIAVYDDKSNQVRELYRGAARSGQVYRVAWEAGALPAGIYICRLVTRKETLYQRIVLRR